VLKTLKKTGFTVRLWRCGGKFTPEQLNFIQEHNLDQDILDFGTPDQSILIQLYNAADILLAPSLYEGFGLTILEAMACGLPVITSNVSSLPEVVDHAAVIVSPLDISAISQAIVNLQQNSLYRQNLITQGLIRAKQLTWKVSAKKLAEIYEKLS
ncbi:MAG: glycosyltransferase, partial [Dolichospermum sp.]